MAEIKSCEYNNDNDTITVIKTAELVLNGKMQQFLAGVDKNRHKIENNVKQQLISRFGENIAGQIAREFMMYDR